MASLSADALYNLLNGGSVPAGYNDIDFFPDQVHIERMTVKDNLMHLGHYFENTGFNPDSYGIVQFVDVTLYCDL